MSNSDKAFLSGNEALGRGAWEAGLKVACAYPGTPSTEILEALAGYGDIDTQWSVNEKVAYEVAFGAAMGGVRSLYASKHVGLNVAMDPLMTSAYTGINAGLVVVVCDDPAMHSSQNEQDTRWAALYAKLPVLEPSDPAEAREFVKIAFDISEQFDTPVMLRLTTRVSHSKETMQLAARVEAPAKAFETDWTKYVMVPGNARKRHAVLEKRLGSLRAYAESSSLNRVEAGSGTRGYITSSVSYQYVKECFPDAPVLKLGIANPLCIDKIRAFVESLDEGVVVEELDPYFETLLHAEGIPVRAKHPSFRLGELKPELIPSLVEGKEKDEPQRAMRPPMLCKGCPHRLTFKALNELGAVVAGDIGCYTLGALPPFSALHSCLCMGAGVTVHEGLRRAGAGDKVVGVVGDSTFIHSGITGLINAAYNKVKGLVMVLDNSTTAMTGGQNHPATGKTIRNEPTKQLSIDGICRACGVDNVDVIRPQAYKEMKELIAKRMEQDALSVIVVQSPCMLLR